LTHPPESSVQSLVKNPPAPPRGASIQARDVIRAFEGHSQRALDRVSLTIEPGEFVTILGPSGCGKSTLLRLVAGLDVPQAGTLEVTPGTGDARFFRSFVFQEAQLVPWRTALENVALPLELMGIPKAERLERASRELARVGLSDAAGRYPLALSGGMKMRVSVARALVTQPGLLLLDEPFSALDENTRHHLQEDLRRIWESTGLTVLFVTHSVSEAVFLSNRILVFSKRPARLLSDQKVDLPSPRPERVRTDARFTEAIRQIYASAPEEEAPL
jgi:NitT/TauT family transport system ATP-binding protein